MPIAFADKGIQNVCFKLSLPVKFAERLRFLIALGMSKEDAVEVDGVKVVPRDFICKMVDQHVKETTPETPAKPDDHKVLKIIVDGVKDGVRQQYSIESAMDPYEPWNMSMGTFTVGFPAAITT